MTQPTLHTITSHGYKATISNLGAELKSLMNESTSEAYLWSGEPSIWQGTAPILFPIVGRLKNGEYQHQGKTYQLAKHGFARNTIFELELDNEDEKSFVMRSSPETLKQYPFEFALEVFFSLNAHGLTVRYEVRNTGHADMLFTLGSHPAFSLPTDNSRLEDYSLIFEVEEQLDCYFLENDLLCTQPLPAYLDNSNSIAISAALFNNDALIFKNIQSRQVSIYHQQTGKRLTLAFEKAPHFGIWAKAGAAFICLEPWFSYDDSITANGRLSHKEGMLSLAKEAIFHTHYRVIF